MGGRLGSSTPWFKLVYSGGEPPTALEFLSSHHYDGGNKRFLGGKKGERVGANFSRAEWYRKKVARSAS